MGMPCRSMLVRAEAVRERVASTIATGLVGRTGRAALDRLEPTIGLDLTARHAVWGWLRTVLASADFGLEFGRHTSCAGALSLRNSDAELRPPSFRPSVYQGAATGTRYAL
jgi:hypothetical protein